MDVSLKFEKNKYIENTVNIFLAFIIANEKIYTSCQFYQLYNDLRGFLYEWFFLYCSHLKMVQASYKSSFHSDQSHTTLL